MQCSRHLGPPTRPAHLGWRCDQAVSTVKITKQSSWMASPPSVMPHPSRIWPWSGVPEA